MPPVASAKEGNSRQVVGFGWLAIFRSCASHALNPIQTPDSVNLILFELDEISRPLRRTDTRATHILGTLRLKAGDRFDAGIVNGPRGKVLIAGVGDAEINFEFTPQSGPAPLDPLDVIVGLPRPQTARRILHDAAALGVRRITFVTTSRSDPNYARSRLWDSGEWRRHLIDGAQQAFDTRIPEVEHGTSLSEVGPRPIGTVAIAFDNYEATASLPQLLRSEMGEKLRNGSAATLAFGPERGWHADDRQLLRRSAFALVSLGRRVMRVETAIASAVAVLRAETGWQ